MPKRIVVVLLVATGILATIFTGVYLAIGHYNAKAELNRAKASLIREVDGFSREADRQLAYGWYVTAKDYLSEYERGRLDGLFGREGTDNGFVAAEAYTRVREVFTNQMMEKGDYPITVEKVNKAMRQDDRIKRLFLLCGAKADLLHCAFEAQDTERIERVEEIRDALEAKKQELVRLLKSSET